MDKIILNNDIVAIIHRKNDWIDGLNFITSDSDFIQTGTWKYNTGKILSSHRHKFYSRVVLQTQETIIIMNGSLKIDFYNLQNEIFHQVILGKGDIGVILNVGHGYEILNDCTQVIEVKNGTFHFYRKR